MPGSGLLFLPPCPRRYHPDHGYHLPIPRPCFVAPRAGQAFPVWKTPAFASEPQLLTLLSLCWAFFLSHSVHSPARQELLLYSCHR